jgi:hypothetical protein
MALPLPQGGAAVQKTVLNEGCPVTTLGTAEPSGIGSAETPDPIDRSARGSHRETPWLCGRASARGEPWGESARPDSGTSCRDRKRPWGTESIALLRISPDDQMFPDGFAEPSPRAYKGDGI